MKAFKHIVRFVVWALIGLYFSIIVLLQLSGVQSFLGSQVAQAISDKLGTRVSVGRVDLGLFNRIIIDDVLILDQRGKEMLKAARLTAKVDIAPLAEGRISISSAQAFGTHLKLYKASAGAKPNYQFALDSLASKDTTRHSSLDLRVNSFIMRHSSVAYDRYDIAPTPGKFNANHLRVTDISAHIILKALNEDSLNVNVKRIALKEQSGLKVNRLSLKLSAGKSRCLLSDVHVELPRTNFGMDSLTATYRTVDGKPQMATLQYAGSIVESQVTPADFACFVPQLKKLDESISLSTNFHGTSTNLRVPHILLKSTGGSIVLNANGWIRNWEARPLWNAAIKELEVSQEVVATMMGIAGIKDSSIIKPAARLGDISFRGVAAATRNNELTTTCQMQTAAGHADMFFAMSRDRNFKGSIATDGFDLKQATGNEKMGDVSAHVDLRGSIKDKAAPSLSIKGTIDKLDYNGYEYSKISVDGTSVGKKLSGLLSIDDDNANLAVEGYLDKTAGQTDIKISATINRLCPKALNMTDKWGESSFMAGVNADFKASGLNDAKGNIVVNGLKMVSPTDTFAMQRASVTSGFNADTHYLALDSDFGRANLTGKFEYSTLAQSFTNFIGEKLPTLPGLPKTKHTAANDFLVRAEVWSTVWMEKLLGIPLHINKPINLHAKVDDEKRDISLDCNVGSFSYNDTGYSDGAIVIKSQNDTLVCNVGVTRLSGKGGKMAMQLEGRAINNNLATSFTWNDTATDKFSGRFNAVSQFYRAQDGKQIAAINVQPSHININDVVWNVLPSSITYSKNNIEVAGFAIKHGGQHIIINGKATPNAQDSLAVDLSGIDVGYVLDLVNFHAVEFSGQASGRAYVMGLFGNPAAKGTIAVDNFKFEEGRMGVLNAMVDWNNQEKQIDINAIANDGPDAMTYINGYVSPSRNYIDLGISAAGTHIDFVESFTESFLGNVSGQAQGSVRVIGPLKQINLVGKLAVNGEATVIPTNCKYYLRNDTIAFEPNEIRFLDAPIFDIHNQKGIVSGALHHKYLKDLSYDLGVKADNLLAYDFREFGDNTFCGTVFASGDVGIHGRKGEVNIDINITPKENSTFSYNVSNPDAVADQGFIKWNDSGKAEGNNGQDNEAQPAEEEDTPTDTHLNFLLNCTPDVTIKLLMDSRTNDYITLNGSGTLRASYYNKGSFNMFGTYTVLHGTYGITIQDIIKKNFVFNEGSSITFRGNPYHADLNLQAEHTVNGVSLSDLNVGNSFTNNTIRVNCLMNIGGQPQRPVITFDLDMPTVSSDEKQMIKSIINSEEEMNQQVIYLLGIGRFYPQRENNAAEQNEGQQSQTTLAMQSLLSGTISTQINNVLNSVIKSNNWNFGANISTGDEGWNNAEYEGLLSGRLLDNRLLINGQFGYRDNSNTANTSFIGDFDIRYLLKPNGNLSIKVYNQTNDRYFTKSSLNTQGIGIIMKKDFDGFKDLFNIKKKKKQTDKTK